MYLQTLLYKLHDLGSLSFRFQNDSIARAANCTSTAVSKDTTGGSQILLIATDKEGFIPTEARVLSAIILELGFTKPAMNDAAADSNVLLTII